MRHKKSGRKLGRTPSHRKALLRNLAKALLIHGRITTTLAKAKDLRGVVEPLVTLALRNDLHARRTAYRFLGEHKLVSRLFTEIGPSFANGGGGYTRVVKLAAPRRGDAAPLAIIEFIRKPGETPPAAKQAILPAGNPEVKAVASLPAKAEPLENPSPPAYGEAVPASSVEREPD
jgi:large subunit ribosomal protein L17